MGVFAQVTFVVPFDRPYNVSVPVGKWQEYYRKGGIRRFVIELCGKREVKEKLKSPYFFSLVFLRIVL